ncbi:hypothetical protein SAMN05421847_2941 [Halpernia humi]|uniref:Uncharacterized protein n=1 Tax=Halpernia humi TaxID=493375 RepID=A0A1H6BKR0_9FLAO|nr:contractile injection system tape measure protein [Halpernia humi]SEG60967.1 hypothetical protein SAMN05421847_2941 [Halpernia humi]
MHLITKNTIEIDCKSAQFGKEMQNDLGFLLENNFYPKLENLLNLYDEKYEIWKIECIDINISEIEHKNWKEVLIKESLLQIENYLIENKPLIKYKNNHVLTNENQDLNAVISMQENARFLFLNYLKNGILEENTISKNIDEIVKQIQFSEDFVIELIKLFHQNNACVLRFIFNAPKYLKEEIYLLLHFTKEKDFLFDFFKDKKRDAPKLQEFLHKFQNKEQGNFWFEFLEWMVLLLVKSDSYQTYINQFLAESKRYWGISEVDIKAVFKYFIQLKNYFEAEYLQFFYIILDHSEIETLDTKTEVILTKTLVEKTSFQKALFIENAGLVILHPFLKALFEKLNLSKNEIWRNEISQQKAILLSQYLVTGKEETQESDLLLNKILCGFDLNKVINTKLKITKTEKESCNNLLEAVLEHWTAMSKSSTVALQQTFLQRKAKLEETQDRQFEMWVEEKGFDILLNQLPWGIGMIKTPWMEEFLFCNWN